MRLDRICGPYRFGRVEPWPRRRGWPPGTRCFTRFVDSLGYREFLRSAASLERSSHRSGLTGLIGHSQAQWLAGMPGAPLMLAALGLAVVLQIGLLGRAIDDSRREWWSRLGAFLAIYSVAALTLGSAAVYAPWLADFVMKGTWVKWLSGSVTLGGITAV